MTGTPISNTIAEVYTLQRYLQYEEPQVTSFVRTNVIKQTAIFEGR